MSRIGKQRDNFGIYHRRSRLEVRVFGVPACNCGVVLSNRSQRIGSGSLWRVCIEVILEDLPVQGLKPRGDERRLPEPGGMIRSVGPREVLDIRDLLLELLEAGCGRRGQAEVIGG